MSYRRWKFKRVELHAQKKKGRNGIKSKRKRRKKRERKRCRSHAQSHRQHGPGGGVIGHRRIGSQAFQLK